MILFFWLLLSRLSFLLLFFFTCVCYCGTEMRLFQVWLTCLPLLSLSHSHSSPPNIYLQDMSSSANPNSVTHAHVCKDFVFQSPSAPNALSHWSLYPDESPAAMRKERLSMPPRLPGCTSQMQMTEPIACVALMRSRRSSFSAQKKNFSPILKGFCKDFPWPMMIARRLSTEMLTAPTKVA